MPKKAFVGVEILKDDAHVVMGAKSDVKVLRLAKGTLTFVAPNVNFITDSFMVCYVQDLNLVSPLIFFFFFTARAVGEWQGFTEPGTNPVEMHK